MKRVNDELMDTIAKEAMIDEWREKIHNQFAPCSNEKFLVEYTKLDPSFESLLWDEYDVNLDDLKEIITADETSKGEKLMDRNVQVAMEIVELFDDLLEKKGLTIHCNDPDEEAERHAGENSAKIYGMEAAGLIDSIAEMLDVEYMEINDSSIANILLNMSSYECSYSEDLIVSELGNLRDMESPLYDILENIAILNKKMYNKGIK